MLEMLSPTMVLSVEGYPKMQSLAEYLQST